MPKKNRGMKHGICRICGEEALLTFEHIPPKMTGNNTRANVYRPRLVNNSNNKESNSTVSNPFMQYAYQSRRGMGDYSLCERCNNYCGRYYVQPFNDFYGMIKQAVGSLQSEEMRPGTLAIFDSLHIIPPAIFKQLMANMCCTTQPGPMSICKDYLLDKTDKNPPTRFQLFMQLVPLSSRYISTGWCSLRFKNNTYCQAAMLSIPPLKLTLVDRYKSDLAYISSPAINDLGQDITYFARLPWCKSPHTMMTPFAAPIPDPISAC